MLFSVVVQVSLTVNFLYNKQKQYLTGNFLYNEQKQYLTCGELQTSSAL